MRLSYVPILCLLFCIFSCSPSEKPTNETTKESIVETSKEQVVLAESARDQDASQGTIHEERVPVPEAPQKEEAPKEQAPDVAQKPNHCQQDLTWSRGTNFPYPRDHHHTFISASSGKPYLFVIGGANYKKEYSDVWRAPIKEDGSIGEWVSSLGSYPSYVHAAGLVQVPKQSSTTKKERIFLISGAYKKYVYSADVKEDGTLGFWTKHKDVPDARYHLSAEYYKGFLYAIGGLNKQSNATDTIYRGKPNEQGKIESWDTFKLPKARTHHSSFIKHGYLYLVGGFHGNSWKSVGNGHKDIIRAKLGDDGRIGTWETVGTLEWELVTQSNVAFDNCLYIFAGLTMGKPFTTYHNSILRGGYDGKKYSKLIRMTKKLEKGVSHTHHAPYYKGRVYLVGGSEAYRKLTGFVQIGTFKK